ncbi:hypothetical protein COX99_02660 [Candidatus Pacearchaeota archaeon CG_4_10_14_0_2_um_filter_31_10]|nr:MAG: hypothetical protein COX99_02660 [Candidatus Pacearchaeota archaeon CG_4_10_14_0_2_um_filter_31_10]
MPFIKKLVMQGFKSFAKQTELIFEKNLNVVVGPNGSGKSNVTDAICFVLGRLSMKSIRAERSSHLIYNGGKYGKPAQEARVDLIFDNTDGGFSIQESEIKLTRIVRKEGVSIYKINNQTKTRQEILELLARVGIDPEGFNIILQGQIARFVSMPSERRREIIEEVAGISIYEQRKEKSLKELDRTEERLKEVRTILNERSSYLRNLEKERSQALKYNSLKRDIKRDKLSIINKKIEDKKDKLKDIEKEIEERKKKINKTKEEVEKLKREAEKNNTEIISIEKEITTTTGVKQDVLREEISNLNTEIAGLNIRLENFKTQQKNLEKRQEQLTESLKEFDEKIKNFEEEKEKQESARTTKRQDERVKEKLHELQKELAEIKVEMSKLEELKHKTNVINSEIIKKEALLEEKEKQYLNLKQEIHSLEIEIENIKKRIKKDEEFVSIKHIKEKRKEHEDSLKTHQEEFLLIREELSKLLTQKEIYENDLKQILKLNKCPKCKQNVNQEYKEKLEKETNEFIKEISYLINEKKSNIENISDKVKELTQKVKEFFEKEHYFELIARDEEQAEEKQIRLEKIESTLKVFETEIDSFKTDIEELKETMKDPRIIDDKYDSLKEKYERTQESIIKIKSTSKTEDVLSRDFDIEISIAQQEYERTQSIIKNSKKELVELKNKIDSLEKDVKTKDKILRQKREEEEKINKKFRKSLERKSKLQSENSETNEKINQFLSSQAIIDAILNEVKIKKAKIDAEIETITMEFNQLKQECESEGFIIKENKEEISEDDKINIIILTKNLKIEELETRLLKNEIDLREIGSVNLRALQVYEEIKKEYDLINEKVEQLEKEKESVLKTIFEIDKKKRHQFMKTFEAINDGFSRNFMNLSTKGHAFLQLENEKDPFSGGVDIMVKLAKGKYMDIESLSGGEKVIITISLLFAIQEYSPFNFYLFDEIEEALDKRNSEKLANLIKKSTEKAQYIIITHNDSIITVADNLYGITMQEGISKVVSIKV